MEITPDHGQHCDKSKASREKGAGRAAASDGLASRGRTPRQGTRGSGWVSEGSARGKMTAGQRAAEAKVLGQQRAVVRVQTGSGCSAKTLRVSRVRCLSQPCPYPAPSGGAPPSPRYQFLGLKNNQGG